MYIFNQKNNEIIQTLYILRPQNLGEIKNKLRQCFKATPNSEYERVVDRVENVICNLGQNLNEEYNQLFAIEYSDFYIFLEEEEELDDVLISKIKSKCKKGDCLWKVIVSDYEGYNFANLFDASIWNDDNLIIILNQAIEGVLT